ncbi:prenyltransferase [Gemmata sp. SH-PL17]|nr:UbiA family prenyltransferase [Gemmata sp. SH-PL17]AMV29908.1 prenyltransferase [Gemmata sp. SH-PL17]
MPTVVSKLLELIRFSHTIFALPFAILAAALAWRDEKFRWQDMLGILLCMVFARSAAMAFNRVMDRHIDAANPRTAGRHLPAGTLRVGTVWAFTLVCCLGFVASTLLFCVREPENPWPLYCSTPVLLFVLGYSLAKRFTSLAHFWLGGRSCSRPLRRGSR